MIQQLYTSNHLNKDHTLQENLYNFTKTLLARGYDLNIINNNITKALQKTQDELLTTNTKNTPRNLLPIVSHYFQEGTTINKLIHDNWHILLEDPNLHFLKQQTIKNAYKKHSTLKDQLTHSDLT